MATMPRPWTSPEDARRATVDAVHYDPRAGRWRGEARGPTPAQRSLLRRSLAATRWSSTRVASSRCSAADAHRGLQPP
jgi:hypothetical protein